MTEQALEDLSARLSAKTRIAVDLEGEWNLHRYGLHLCLIQLCDGDNTWLVDPFEVKNISSFIRLMENPDVLKISHGPQSDIILLNYRYGALPRNIFDTEKAAQFLLYPSTSLSSLLQQKFNVSKNLKIRELDWINRPLTDEMMEYAAMDVQWLLPLHDELSAELEAKGRTSWQAEENLALETLRWKKKENPWLEIKGANKLTPVQVHLLKTIYEVRDVIACELDKPAYHIIANDKLITLATDPPPSQQAWENLKGVNPRIRGLAPRFFHAVQEALANPPAQPVENGLRTGKGKFHRDRVRWAEKVTEKLEAVKAQIAQEYDVAPLILSTRMIKRICFAEIRYADLRQWQRNIIESTAEKMGIRLDMVKAPPPGEN